MNGTLWTLGGFCDLYPLWNKRPREEEQVDDSQPAAVVGIRSGKTKEFSLIAYDARTYLRIIYALAPDQPKLVTASGEAVRRAFSQT